MRTTSSKAFTVGSTLVAASLVVAGCAGGGGEAAPAAETYAFELSCARNPFGAKPVATFLARVRGSSGAAPDAAVPISFAGALSSLRMTIPANASVQLEDFEDVDLPPGQEIIAHAVAGGQRLEASCVPGLGPSATLQVRAAAACGATCTTSPTWSAIPGTLSYRVTVSHPAAIGGALEPVTLVTTGTAMPATAAMPGSSVVRVSAWLFDPDHLGTTLPVPRVAHATTLVTSRPPDGFGASIPGWALYGPDDFVGDVLSASVPASMAGEQLAVMLVNIGAGATATVTVTGTGAPPASGAGSRGLAAALPARVAGLARAPGAAGAARAIASAAARERSAIAIGDRRSFCTAIDPTWIATRAQATVRHVSAKGVFWVADDAQASVDGLLASRPDFLSHLGAVLDAALPTLTSKLGPVPDVDADGRVAVLLRRIAWQALVEIPGAADDPTADCSATGQNRSDLVVFTDPVSLAASLSSFGIPNAPDDLVDRVYPGSVTFGLGVLVEIEGQDLSLQGDPWLVQALANVGADLVGFEPDSAVSTYLREFRRDSLTGWNDATAEPALQLADYGGVGLLMHTLRERIGDGFLPRLVNVGRLDRAAFERATGFPLELALVHLATTAVFSNEPGTPAPWADLADPRWAPLHLKHGPVARTPLTSGVPVVSALLPDGWDALVTGVADSSPVTLTVTAAGRKPWVIVARY